MIWVSLPSRARKARESPMWARTSLLWDRRIAISVVPMPCSAGLGLGHLGELVVGGRDPLQQSRTRLAAAQGLTIEVDERADHGGRRDVTAGVAAHAVGHRQQARPGIPGVLVLRTDHADVGARGVVEGEGHRRGCLTPQLDDGLADPQRAAGLDPDGAGEPLGADEGAVGGAEVLDEPGAVAVEDPGVPAAGEVVVEDQRALGVAADDRCPPRAAAGWCR